MPEKAEKPKRLTPTPAVTRRLYLASGNRCAYPGCEQALMGADGVLVGEIAHIEGAMPTSARFSKDRTNDQRRAYENLLLLCATHHTRVDQDATWTVERLRELKQQHEAIYTDVIEQLRRQVGDVTEGVSYTPATNGLAVLDADLLDEEQLRGSLDTVNEFAQRLTAIPGEVRSVLALILRHGDDVPAYLRGGHWEAELWLPITVLESHADCTRRELRAHIEVLEHYDLLHIDTDPFDAPPSYILGNSTPGVGWPLLGDIKKAVGDDLAQIRRLVCDLDFGALDR